MNVSAETGKLLEEAVMLAEQKHHEYVTPEHLLYALTLHDIFVKAFRNCGGSIDRLKKNIEEYFEENLEKVGEGEIKLTAGFEQVLMQAESRAVSSERITVDLLHIVCGLFELEEIRNGVSNGVYMDSYGITLKGSAVVDGFAVYTGTDPNSSDFSVISTNKSLPSPGSNKGKIKFVRFVGKRTLSGSIMPRNSGSSVSSVEHENKSAFYISNGTYWYEFFCYYG